MKKHLLILLSALMLITSVNIYAVDNNESNINKMAGLVNTDLEEKVLDYKLNDYTSIYIPAREVFTKLDFRIYWDNEEKSCYFKKGIKNIKAKVASHQYITSNKNSIELNREPKLINDKLYVPLEILYYLLDYDVFTIDDTIFIRNAIEGIKTGLINKDKLTVAYPIFFSAEDIKRAYRNNINTKIKAFIENQVEKSKSEASLDHLYITYDIARSDDMLVSICFNIKKVYNDSTQKNEFYSKTFNYNNAEEIAYNQLIKKSQKVREKVLDDLTEDEEEKNSIRNNVKNFYMVDDALIIYYYKTYEGSSKIGSHYIRREDLDFYINEEYLKYFN